VLRTMVLLASADEVVLPMSHRWLEVDRSGRRRADLLRNGTLRSHASHVDSLPAPQDDPEGSPRGARQSRYGGPLMGRGSLASVHFLLAIVPD
jgi:hypothetical protein